MRREGKEMEDWPGCQDPAQLGQNVERVAPVNVRPTPERDTANSWILAGGTTRSLPRFLRASTVFIISFVLIVAKSPKLANVPTTVQYCLPLIYSNIKH